MTFRSQSATVLADVEQKIPELFALQAVIKWDAAAPPPALSQVKFLRWQFERLLNAAADLFDRANEDRSKLLALIASDFDFRLQLAAEGLRVNQDANRVKLSGDALADPAAYAALNSRRMKLLFDLDAQIDQDYANQEANLRILTQTADAAQKARANADFHGLQVTRRQWSTSGLAHQRELEAENEELGRVREFAALALSQFNEKSEAASKGGPLDLRHEALVVAKRMLRDFNEGLDRLSAAQDGMKEVLGKRSIALVDPRLTVIDAVASATETARTLIHWYSLFTQFDQSFTVSVELRDFLTDEQWSDFLEGSTVPLEVDPKAFSAWALPRIRGLSASYGGADTRAIRLRVRPPQLALRTDLAPVVQAVVPSCTLGRVWNASASREPELGGAVTLMNTNPIQAIGHSWEIQLERFGPKAANKDYRIDSLAVEIACVGIPIEFYESAQNLLDK